MCLHVWHRGRRQGNEKAAVGDGEASAECTLFEIKHGLFILRYMADLLVLCTTNCCVLIFRLLTRNGYIRRRFALTDKSEQIRFGKGS